MDATLIFLAAVLGSIPSASSDAGNAEEEMRLHLGRTYADMDLRLRHLMRGGASHALRAFGEVTSEFRISDRCRANALRLLSGWRELELWALTLHVGFEPTESGTLTIQPSFGLNETGAQVLGWMLAAAAFITALFFPQRWNLGHPYTRLGSALFFPLARLLYSWSVGWLVLCCATGHGGFINGLLSWPLWIPLNRLCLSAYLLSLLLQLHHMGNLRTPPDFQTEVEIWGYFGDLAVTCLLSVPLVLTIESPFMALDQAMFRRPKERKGANNVQLGNDTQ